MKNLNNFILDLQREFEKNEKVIKKANDIDLEINKNIIEIDEIKKILNQYKNISLINKELSKYIVIYNGDPYLSVNILMQALIGKCQILLLTDEFMTGVNSIIFSIFRNILKKYKLNIFFENQADYSIKQIKDLSKENQQIIVIGNSNTMQSLEELENVKFYPYNNIILYSDNEKYEELQKVIYKYAQEKQYELEIIYEEELEDVVKVINADEFVDTVILLSENEKIKEIFKNIKNKRVFINSNPFTSKSGKIYNYFNI